MKIIHQSDYKTNTWKGGITRELYINPESSSLNARDFNIRISSAIIDSTESVFSDFTGYQRYILPVKGSLTLFRNGKAYRLSPNAPFRFSGDEAIKSENSKGAIDFNVIFRAELPVSVKVTSDEHYESSTGRTLLFALEPVTVNGKPIECHDAVLLSGAFAVKGRVVVVSIP